jgi:hypothetical protein
MPCWVTLKILFSKKKFWMVNTSAARKSEFNFAIKRRKNLKKKRRWAPPSYREAWNPNNKKNEGEHLRRIVKRGIQTTKKTKVSTCVVSWSVGVIRFGWIRRSSIPRRRNCCWGSRARRYEGDLINTLFLYLLLLREESGYEADY